MVCGRVRRTSSEGLGPSTLLYISVSLPRGLRVMLRPLGDSTIRTGGHVRFSPARLTQLLFVLISGVCMTALSALAIASPNGGPVGVFSAHADIGEPKLKGSAIYNAATQEYRLTGGGTNIWGERDEFHFAHRTIKGDFILQARTEFVGSGVDPHRKAGWMARQGLAADAPYVDAVIHG